MPLDFQDSALAFRVPVRASPPLSTPPRVVYLERASSCILEMSSRDVTSRLRERVWNGSIPLQIRLSKEDCRTYDDSDPYLVSIPNSFQTSPAAACNH